MRRKPAPKRTLMPDHKYNNVVVSRLINYVMWDGKKSVARDVIYDAFDIIAEKTKQEPLDVFDEAIKNTSPMLEVKSRRIGGANYQVPKQVKGDRRLNLSLRWMIQAARSRKGATMAVKLAEEIISASKNEGEAVKKKENTHKMAHANRAFAHFSW
ncbi:MAG: 30S ribosomal protein S7 [Candidatus Spechtbacteria bacterium RIFCSPHIGHO2_02_FULL_43_15b]|uniref:Small ribosomal subunit protein uS7 n=1 Tax=Candidatus Spechtbacteria bacterium RIFCSPHIGHO2_01_FULL_43_30 TaxID=1802158 RepID=A0A1G2H8J2_9BACT|nr:MAG: 30S ribosomal protein S7 [Candidatus Spechtbacteria bacterium RIFCSPHIGHO2_01_FULL_43_30]OGZ59719.1 MAG: 30S ribosomal protein S7 [Candidatus Spechtbacteria bacterium RIFCSPHIGHO2_02_FULL_43_15b]